MPARSDGRSTRARTRRPPGEHRFIVVLDGARRDDAGLEDALHAAGCDDAILVFRAGVASLEFDRRAADLKTAILSALLQIGNTRDGVVVSHVEPDDLVSAAEIARRLDVSREYVRLLVQGRRGPGGFPAPVSGVSGTAFVWSWVAVLGWLDRNGQLQDPSALERARIVADVNAALVTRGDRAALKRRLALGRRLAIA